jgi:hypothetical protein
MPEENGQAVFQEVLEVGVDPSIFAQGLRQLEAEYDAFIERVSAKGLDSASVLNIGGIASVSNALQGLSGELGTIRQGLAETLSVLSNTLADSMTKVTEVIDEKFTAIPGAAKESGEKLVETEQEIIDRILEEVSQGLAKQTSITAQSNQVQAKLFQQLWEEIASGNTEVFTLLTANNQKWFDQQIRTQELAAADYQKYVNAMTAADEKRFSAMTKAFEKGKEQELKAAQASEDLAAKQAAADTKRFESLERSFGVGKDKQLAAERKADEQMQAEFQKTIDAEIKQYEQLVAAAQKAETARVAAGNKAEAELRAMTKLHMAAIQEDMERSQSSFGRFAGSLLKDIPSMAGALLRFQLIWGTLNLAISAVEAPFKAVVGMFAEGFNYLTKLQSGSAELQAVLAHTVEFSTNIAENFRIAGQAAIEVRKEIEDMAAKTGLSVQVITTAFTAFEEGGGRNFTQSLREDVEVAASLAQAMQTVVANSQDERKIADEISKFLAGTLPPASNLGKVLGMNNEEMKKFVEHAREHGTLLADLEPKLRPFLSVQQDANLRMSAMNQLLENAKNRAFALVAEPVWSRWIGFLEKAKSLYEEHKNEIDAMLSMVGELLGHLLDLAVTVLPAILAIFKFIATEVVEILAGLDLWTIGLNGALEILKLVADILQHPSKLFNKDEVAEFGNKLLDVLNKVGVETDKVQKRVEDFQNGTNTAGTTVKGLLDTNPKGTKNPPPLVDKPSRAQLMTQFQTELEEEKNFVNKLKEAYAEMIASNKISQQDASRDMEAVFNDEKKIIDTLVVKYKALADIRLPKKQAEAFKDTLGKIQTGATGAGGSVDQQSSAERVKADKAEQTEQVAAQRQKMVLQKIADKERLDEIKKSVADGLTTRKQGIQQEVIILQNEQKAEDALFKLETAGMSTTSEKYLALNRQKQLSDAQRIAMIKLLSSQTAQAAREDDKAIRTLAIQAIKDRIAYLQEEIRIQKQLGNSHQEVIKLEKELKAAKGELHEASALSIQDDINAVEAMLLKAKANGQVTDALEEELKKLREKLQIEQDLAKLDEKKTAPDGSTKTGAPGLDSLFKGVTDDMGGLGKAVTVAANALQMLPGIISGIKQGFASGGTLGGLGAIATTAASFDPEPISKGILTIAGSIMTMFGGMFKKAAEDMAKRLSKEFKEITDKLAAGTIDLKTAIADTQAKRAEAITKLSGMKGGQEQLDKLLPEFDKEIAALQKQAADIKDKFEGALKILRLQSDELGTALKTWQDINAQVKEYIAAGGDAKKASEFLSLSLQKLKQTEIDNFHSGEQEAIQQAIQLNDLLKQRIKLVEDFQKQEFDLQNADAMERQQSNAVRNGQALEKARKDYQDQLATLDAQISLETQKLDKEKQVFQISSDLNELHRRDEELTLIALDEQLARYKDMATIINGIIQKSDGSFTLSDALLTALGLPPNKPTTTGLLGGQGGGGRGKFSDELDFLRRNQTGQIGTINTVDPNNLSLNALGQPVIGGTSTTIGSLSLTVNTNQPVDGQQLYDQLNNEITRAQRQGRRGFYRRMSSGF